MPFLAIPLLGDDYIQIMLGRTFGPVTGWADLAQDVLYRCRATSLLLTYFLDSLFGPDATVHRLVNVALHGVNIALVMALGAWSRIGWSVAVPAAVFFAVHEGHQEAVVWTAAMPELLVFLFSVGAVVLWLHGWRAWALAAFVLALLSKESAVVVVPLVAWYWWREEKCDRAGAVWLSAMAVLAAGYTWLIFAASGHHLHLNDAGTFSTRAPFLKTLAISTWRLLWIWGVIALAALAWWRARRDLVLLAFGWIAITLLPYSFLTYMDRVPSRHTYIASAGLALLVGAAYTVCAERLRARPRWVLAAVATVVVAHNVGYLWVKKVDQYYNRAAVTERFLQEAKEYQRPVNIRCGAYPVDIYRAAAMIRLGWDADRVQALDASEERPDGLEDYCDLLHP